MNANTKMIRSEDYSWQLQDNREGPCPRSEACHAEPMVSITRWQNGHENTCPDDRVGWDVTTNPLRSSIPSHLESCECFSISTWARGVARWDDGRTRRRTTRILKFWHSDTLTTFWHPFIYVFLRIPWLSWIPGPGVANCPLLLPNTTLVQARCDCHFDGGCGMIPPSLCCLSSSGNLDDPIDSDEVCTHSQLSAFVSRMITWIKKVRRHA